MSHTAEKTVLQIKALLRDYHFWLDLGQQAAGANFQVLRKLEELFDMPYVQGEEARVRSGRKSLEEMGEERLKAEQKHENAGRA